MLGQPQDELPPPYSETGFPPVKRDNWADNYYKVICQAQSSGCLRAVPQRHWILVIDDNCRLDPFVHTAIKSFVACLLPIFRAYKADARLFFACKRNNEYEPLSHDDKDRANFLEQLLSSSNWGSALNIAQQNETLDHEEIYNWMTHQDGTLNDFYELLSRIQHELHPYRYGWDIEGVGLDNESMELLYEDALENPKPQTHVLNSLALTVRRAIMLIEGRLAAKHAALPTEVLILTGSSLQQSEVNNIREELRNVKGGNLEAGISTLLFVHSREDAIIKQHKKLRSANKAIYDATHIIVSEYLKNGPSRQLFGKVLNRHDKRWRKVLSEGEKYGLGSLASEDDVHLPSVDEAVTALRKSAEDAWC
ncbi:hypothetical protein VFPPC_11519 [Pochonia chlamydosporia 170]|uniref:Uncharacterized protein n=1 Tax=Pochonia chlamydosporia 170 TaxID=1380566 RepID=A0A179F1R7_METCM|nr:hypothetical protein VFPPC_11519 [Pochonia chlamydosporia 170]OAQ59019.1 hypothetical protein VFPPC_11519 [Pochonia chlamydosporia 170]